MRDYQTVLQAGQTLNLYANGTTGDDDNNGLSVLTPKKTLAAVSALVPDKILKGAYCVVHARGTFTGPDAEAEFGSYIYAGGMLLIDGGTDFTELVAAATADISSTTTLGLSTLTMTVDQYAGYWLEILDGAAAGQVRTILFHDATTFSIQRAFSVNPGNASYRIVRPTTTLVGDATYRPLYLTNTGNGLLVVQNFYHTGDRLYLMPQHSGAIRLFAYISENSGMNLYQVTGSSIGDSTYDVVTFATNNLLRRGCSFRGNIEVLIKQCGTTIISGMVMLGGRLEISSSLLNGPFSSRFKQVELDYNSVIYTKTLQFFRAGTIKNYIIGSSAVGLYIRGDASIAANGLEINNCVSHAIEVEHGALSIAGALTGSGNGGAGLYAHSGSAVKIAAATPPVLTGTIGDTSTDGTTEASTWAAIAGGVAIADASEFSLIKAV